MIEEFIEHKITQVHAYIRAVILDKIDYTELDNFINDTMSEWTLLKVRDELPHSAKEHVFWHLIHEVSLYGAKELNKNLFFKSEINSCLDFFKGIGSYPIDCIGWRPIS